MSNASGGWPRWLQPGQTARTLGNLTTQEVQRRVDEARLEDARRADEIVAANNARIMAQARWYMDALAREGAVKYHEGEQNTDDKWHLIKQIETLNTEINTLKQDNDALRQALKMLGHKEAEND